MSNHIIEGFEAFKKRILPARMKDTGENGKVLGDYLRASGYNTAQMTADEISEACFRAASNDSLLRKIDWVVEPASLRKYGRTSGASTTSTLKSSRRTFVEKAQAAEAKKKPTRRQAEALKRTYALIASLPTRPTARALCMAAPASLKTRRASSSNARSRRRPTQRLLNARFVSYLDDLYKEDERNRERV